MSTPNRPSRKLVLAIVTDEANKAGLTVTEILAGKGIGDVRHARRRAMCRIVRLSDCDASGLAAVWGCDRITVSQYAREALTREPGTYDEVTKARLYWTHGDRAHAIIAGRDPETLQDVARWRNLGARARA